MSMLLRMMIPHERKTSIHIAALFFSITHAHTLANKWIYAERLHVHNRDQGQPFLTTQNVENQNQWKMQKQCTKRRNKQINKKIKPSPSTKQKKNYTLDGRLQCYARSSFRGVIVLFRKSYAQLMQYEISLSTRFRGHLVWHWIKMNTELRVWITFGAAEII